MDTGRLLSDSARIIAHNPALWVYGLLLSIVSVTTTGGMGAGAQGLSFELPRPDAPPPPPDIPVPGLPPGLDLDTVTAWLGRFSPQVALVVAASGAVVLFALFLLTTALSAVMRTAIIGLAGEASAGQPTYVANGWRYAWSPRSLRNFALDMALVQAPWFILNVVLFVALWPMTRLSETADPGQAGLAFLACLVGFGALLLLFIPLVIGNVVASLAQREVTLADSRFAPALRVGWRLLRHNLGNVVVLLILSGVVGIIWGLIAFTIGLAVEWGLGVSSNLLTVLMQATSLADLLMQLPRWGVAWLVFVLLGLPLTLYFDTLWTLAYRRFDRQ